MSDEFEARARDIQLGARASRIPGARSFLVARRGEIVFERYFGRVDPGTLHDLGSTKAVVAALIGVAIREGTIGSVGDSLHKRRGRQSEGRRPGGVQEIATLDILHFICSHG